MWKAVASNTAGTRNLDADISSIGGTSDNTLRVPWAPNSNPLKIDPNFSCPPYGLTNDTGEFAAPWPSEPQDCIVVIHTQIYHVSEYKVSLKWRHATSIYWWNIYLHTLYIYSHTVTVFMCFFFYQHLKLVWGCSFFLFFYFSLKYALFMIMWICINNN